MRHVLVRILNLVKISEGLGEGRREKGEGRREKGEGRREKEKGEGKREKGKGKGRREKGKGKREKRKGLTSSRMVHLAFESPKRSRILSQDRRIRPSRYRDNLIGKDRSGYSNFSQRGTVHRAN